MSAELLREAAEKMRERAEGANRVSVVTEQPAWYAPEHLADQVHFREDAEHIASWPPAVALAVARWLDNTATTLEADPDDYCAGKGHDEGFGVEDCGSWWCSNVTDALAVARAYLGRQP